MYLAYKDTNMLFKILPCILIAIFLVMFIGSCCFASSSSREITGPDGQVGTITNRDVLAYDNIFIIMGDKWAHVFLCNGGYFAIRFKEDDTESFRINCFNSDGEEIRSRVLSIGLDGYGKPFNRIISRLNSAIPSDFGNRNGGFTVGSFSAKGWRNSWFYTSHSVRSLNEDGTMGNEEVFQAAPQEGELAKVTKSIDFLEVLQEILGILPIILLIVIGLLALRKAIQVILSLLRQA